MDEIKFEEFFKNHEYQPGKTYTEKSVKTRMKRIRKVAEILNENLDLTVSTDKNMYTALLKLKDQDDSSRNRQNMLRLYYEFKNSKQFPKLEDYNK